MQGGMAGGAKHFPAVVPSVPPTPTGGGDCCPHFGALSSERVRTLAREAQLSGGSRTE